MWNKDIWQKIASLSDDVTACKILSLNKTLWTDYYFQVVFGKRYNNNYFRSSQTANIHFYMENLREIHRMKKEYGYIYKTGDVFLQAICLDSSKDIYEVAMKAVMKDCDEIVKYCIEEKGVNIHMCNDQLFRWACRRGNLELAKYLVEKGAYVHTESEYALVYSIINNHMNVVKYLVEEKNADITVHGNETLREAVKYNRLDIVKYLVERGIDFRQHDNLALRSATQSGYTEIADYLRNI